MNLLRKSCQETEDMAFTSDYNKCPKISKMKVFSEKSLIENINWMFYISWCKNQP